MSESESEFYGLLRHKYTVDVRFYLFTVGFRKCRIIYGRINETPLYIENLKIDDSQYTAQSIVKKIMNSFPTLQQTKAQNKNFCLLVSDEGLV